MDEKFTWSIKNGDLSQLENLIKEKGIDVNQEANGRCPLHFAADYGQAEVISFLLQKGADINKPDKYGITPLLSAIFESHTECVKLLLEKGASKSGKSPSGESYIECAESQEIKNLLS